MTAARRSPRSALFLLLGLFAAALPAAAQSLPARLSDAEFWKLVTDYSEPTGTFPSENFLSNELGYQTVIPELLRTTKPGGVYLGVGPEQNFTYIAALQPKIAFIVDIRRQAVMQHLIYKAVFELSKDRADFLSLLFSRPRPVGVDDHTTPEVLFAAYEQEALDTAMYSRNLDRITNHLVKQHGFTLSNEDVLDIAHVYEIICRDATRLTYNSGRVAAPPLLGSRSTAVVTTVRTAADGRVDTISFLIVTSPNGRVDTMATIIPPRRDTTNTNALLPVDRLGTVLSGGGGFGGYAVSIGGGRNYSVFMAATDGHGVQRSFLANEDNYRTVRDLEVRNMLVPIVGDVSGPKALRSVGQYLTDHHAVVTAYYTSNVEQYLFRNGVWDKFYANVATLPIDSASTFIRSLPADELGSIRDLLAAVAAGQVTTYASLQRFSHP